MKIIWDRILLFIGRDMILIIGIILLFIVFTTTISRRFNIPLIIIALTVGILFGSDITGIVYFDNAKLAQKVANTSLIYTFCWRIWH